jgi:hypothetical protein
LSQFSRSCVQPRGGGWAIAWAAGIVVVVGGMLDLRLYRVFA